MSGATRNELCLTPNMRVFKIDRIAQYYFRPGDYDSEVDGSGSDAEEDNNE